MVEHRAAGTTEYCVIVLARRDLVEAEVGRVLQS